MNDAARVRGGKRVGHLHGVAQEVRDAQARPSNERVERLPGDVLHHDEVGVAVPTDVVNGDDAGVVQGACRLRLSDKALRGSGSCDFVGGQDLDGDVAVQPRIARLVDDAHAAFAEPGFDLVVLERAIDHATSSAETVTDWSLIATSRFSFASRARETSPIPPAPRVERIS